MSETTLTINGQNHTFDAESGDDQIPLLWVIRDIIGFTGTKYGCGKALCGACTVLVDGEPVRSCVTPARSLVGKKITTIEGLPSDPKLGALAQKVQKAWEELSVGQCGYCQGGQIIAATKLLAAKPKPTPEDIDQGMSGHLCRCGTYMDIRRAIEKISQSS